MDDIDRALIRELQRDARRSNRELAAAVHISPSTSSERIRALRAEQVVRGYHADIDLGARLPRAVADRDHHPPAHARNIEPYRTGWPVSRS